MTDPIHSLDARIQDYWKQRASGYSLCTKEELEDQNNVYREILKKWLPGSHLGELALDIGCGPGFLAIELAKLGFKSTGLDSCQAMLDLAKSNAGSLNVDFVLSDATQIPFQENTFDVIASRNVVWNLSDPHLAYHRWFKCLKPGGKLIVFDGNHYRYLTAPNRNDKPHSQTHKHLGQVDISIMENIAKKLPMSSHDRPDYDHKLLDEVGFINIDTIVLSQSQGLVRDFAILCEKNMRIETLLQAVKDGSLDIDKAKEILARAPYEDLGFAKLDTHRAIRTGFAEVVYCQNKADDFLLEIFARLFKTHGEVMGTRCSPEQFKLLKNRLPELAYDPVSRIAKIEKPKNRQGLIAVCTAGTADIAVAEECAQTAEFFGQNVERFYDIGVSGIHRLLSKVERLQKANCVVAIAGMEGALASVIGGLVSNPVIAVPTSVGYGANFHGLSALLTMLNSCSNGVATVNIDNGFGAGFLASQINRLATRKE